MTQRLKQLILLVAVAASSMTLASDCCESSCCGCTQSQNLYQPHAFSVSMAREIMLEKNAWASEEGKDGWHGTFGVSGEYWQNWGESTACDCGPVDCCKSIGAMPFWSVDESNQMSIGDNSGAYALDGYQLGLGPLENAAGGIVENNGTVMLSPKIYQAGADFLLYVGAHQTERGFFAKLNGPVGVMNINPRLSYSDTITAQNYPAGAFAVVADGEVAAPYANIGAAFAGGQGAGSFYKAMKYGLIDCARSTGAKFGDFAVVLGYNLYADDDKHIGVAFRFSAPTGNKADGTYVLEPIFGRNGHWGVGGEVLGHIKCWKSEEHDRHCTFWLDAIVEHLFKSNHCRTFDLKGNGYGSKYLLLAKYSDLATQAVFQNEIINAVNITRLNVQSSFAVEGNVGLGFDFHWSDWNFMIGYAGWGRTCENLSLDCSCTDTLNFSQYAVLGRQTPYNTSERGDDNLCQPSATISKSEDAALATSTTIKDATDATNRLPQLAGDALDICAQQAHAAFTSEVFAQLGYTWRDSDYLPYVALVGGAEFNNSYNNASNFWKVGLQTGLAF